VIEEVSNMQWGVRGATEDTTSAICYSCRGRDLSSCWTSNVLDRTATDLSWGYT